MTPPDNVAAINDELDHLTLRLLELSQDLINSKLQMENVTKGIINATVFYTYFLLGNSKNPPKVENFIKVFLIIFRRFFPAE